METQVEQDFKKNLSQIFVLNSYDMEFIEQNKKNLIEKVGYNRYYSNAARPVWIITKMNCFYKKDSSQNYVERVPFVRAFASLRYYSNILPFYENLKSRGCNCTLTEEPLAMIENSDLFINLINDENKIHCIDEKMRHI